MKWGILGLFFVSGAPALLYQIIWQHHLYTIYGAHAESVAIIVGAFMFGLGIGSLVGGEVSARWRRSPFYLFAIIESLIGVFGYFSLELFDAVGAGTTHLGVFGAGVSSFMLVVLPTVAMGATLPILANALIARLKNVGVSIGNLYFVNTLGSAVAAYASLSIFSAGLGQHGAIEVAVLLNLIVVCAAVHLSYVSGRTTPPAAEKQMTSESATNKVASSDDKRARAFAAVLSLCSGFLALSVEIVWFRVTFLFAQGKAYAFPISLAFFLLGIAAGSLYAARLMKKESAESSRVRMMAADIMLISGITISMVFLFTGVLAATGAGVLLFLLTTLLAFPLGVLFPLLMHAGPAGTPSLQIWSETWPPPPQCHLPR